MAGRNKKNRSRGSAGNNRKTGEDFLQKNKTKSDVIETETGLQYSIVKKADDPGKQAYEGCSVVVHQRISLVNGTVLDDTYKRNKADEASFGELIPGYKEGILLMSEGDRYRFFVPPELGWGRKGSSDKIPPESVLIFDVKLMEVI